MQRREECIRRYMSAWRDADEAAMLSVLCGNVQIIESHGPVYEGIDEVRRWFREWCHIGQVLQWDALRFWHQRDETIVKWYFRCSYNGVTDGFDGLSLIRFSPEGLIAHMEEYQAKAEHHRPYATTKTEN